MMDGNVRRVPETHIREYIKTTGDIAKYPENIMIERGDELHQTYIDRHDELREELRRRKDMNIIPDSPSPKPAESYGMSETEDTQAPHKGNSSKSIPISSLLNPTSDENKASSSATGESSVKRKYESSDLSDSQPSKKFKQDSADITSAT